MKSKNSGEGGFIFISHSRKDIVFVRKLRNALEKAGFEPLCFYLKCMDKCMEDATLKAELESLLMREISSREWFLYVNSEHSQKSEWVEFERQCVKKLGTKKVLQVDAKAKNSVEGVAEAVLRNLRVFISYSQRDEAVAQQIKDMLVDNDYRVFLDEDLPSVIWKGSLERQIVEASKEGFVMVLLSEASNKSEFVLKEVEEALSCDGNVIPVCLGDVLLPAKWNSLFANRQIYHLSSEPSYDEIQKMIDTIGNTLVVKMQLQI